MSYILDALRRADSERERGGVPSLHSQQVPAGLADADDGESSVRAVHPLWWAVGALSVVLGVLLVWLYAGRSPTPEPMPSPAPMPLAVAPVVNAPAPVAPSVTPKVTESQVAQPPVAVQRPAIRSEAPPPPPSVGRTRVVSPTPSGKSAAKSDEEAELVVPSMAALPDDVRRQLPQLNVSGATYSKNAASRMLIVNGQVVREGDQVAKDVVLVQIRLKSAVLSYRGTRYSISF